MAQGDAFEFVVRPASLADVSVMQQIEVDAGRRFARIGMQVVADDPPPPAAQLVAHVESKTAWMAVLCGEPERAVGYALASVVDGEGHLDQVSVADDAGGRGVGSALIEQVIDWARSPASGAVADSVTLTTFADVAWNGPLYERLGFVAIDDLGPELAAIRANEAARGLDAVGRRIAMRRSGETSESLGHSSS
ncbi:MAG: GNAT family N-acetyltransferase [Acidimicrobiales bacterium]